GKGIELNDGVQAILLETLVDECTYGGISVSGVDGGAGAALSADLLVVRGTGPSPNTGKWGYGIAAIDHAALKLTRVLVSDNRAFGVAAMGVEEKRLGTAELSEVLILDTRAADDDGLYPPRGLDIDNGVTASLERVAVLRSANVGVMLMGPLSPTVPLTVTARDLTVRDTVEEPFGRIDGQGIVLLNETDVTLERALIENNRAFGLLVSVYEEGDYTTHLTATDLTVRGTRPQALDDGAGIGVGVYRHAEVTLERALIEDNRTAGLLLYGAESGSCDATLTAKDLTVRGTTGQAADGEHGVGVAVQYGARAMFERALMEENRMYGVMVFGEGAGPEPMLDLKESTVRRTLPRDCLDSPAGCSFAPGVPIA
ncbi:MAG TPA: right-handed parallel beta-helix repeat-containing protein, partial [bacterium]|nr:right-handed parallel beta-helix repeat-containing protein [bacterium]